MSYRKTTNTALILSETNSNTSLALRFMIEDIHRIANPKTPKDKGNLRADVIKSVNGLRGRIEWSKEYAVYQEYKQFTNYTTSGTGPHYAENSVVDVVQRSRSYFRKAGI